MAVEMIYFYVSDLCCDVAMDMLHVLCVEYQVIYVTVLNTEELSWQFDAPTVLGLSNEMNLYSCISV